MNGSNRNDPFNLSPIDDFRDIPDFLERCRRLFDDITGRYSALLFPQQYRQQLRTVFEEEIDGQISEMIAEYDNKVARTSRATLAQAGIAPGSPSLTLKFQIIKDAWHRFKREGGIKALKALLKAINILLGSIIAALGRGEAVKEFKEFIEWLIDR